MQVCYRSQRRPKFNNQTVDRRVCDVNGYGQLRVYERVGNIDYTINSRGVVIRDCDRRVHGIKHTQALHVNRPTIQRSGVGENTGRDFNGEGPITLYVFIIKLDQSRDLAVITGIPDNNIGITVTVDVPRARDARNGWRIQDPSGRTRVATYRATR